MTNVLCQCQKPGEYAGVSKNRCLDCGRYVPTPTKADGIEEILEKFYGNSINAYSDGGDGETHWYVNEQAVLAIKEYYLGMLPDKITPDIARIPLSEFQLGHNAAIQEMRERMK